MQHLGIWETLRDKHPLPFVRKMAKEIIRDREQSVRFSVNLVAENAKNEIITCEQATKIAEYIALAHNLKATAREEEEYRRVNQLAWELALWMPDDIYRKLSIALTKPTSDINIFSVLIDIRKLVMRNPGTLNFQEIISHAPNIGLG